MGASSVTSTDREIDSLLCRAAIPGVDELLSRALVAFSALEQPDYEKAMGDIGRLGLGHQVHDAFRRLLRDAPLKETVFRPEDVSTEPADVHTGLYAHLVERRAGWIWFERALQADIPIPVVQSMGTDHGRIALGKMCAEAFSKSGTTFEARLLGHFERAPVGPGGRDMLDWLIGVGDYRAQILDDLPKLVEVIDGRIALIRAAQARLEIKRLIAASRADPAHPAHPPGPPGLSGP